MALMNYYLTSAKNLPDFMNAIVTATAPKKFTTRFLQNLEFASSADRLFIGLLKGLKFLDESGAPTQRYYDYLDQTQSKRVLAEAIREAYSDLFDLNRKAQEMSADEVKNKLRSLTQGQKSDDVLQKMVTTFKKLCELADWTAQAEAPVTEELVAETPVEKTDEKTAEKIPSLPKTTPVSIPLKVAPESDRPTSQLHYNIQIHLPESRDPAVFDAIFRSLKEHLL